jgi:sugar phosphate isomerase/epimerase
MPFDISLQLYTIRDSLKDDFIAGLAGVADMGYRFVEFAGFGRHSAKEIASAMKTLGLSASGAHIPVSILEDPAPIVDELREIGCSEATLPWLPETMRDWPSVAVTLDRCAEKLREQGIALGYHNHAFEFDKGGYRALVEKTRQTNFQLDVYWAAYADEDPVKWIGKLAGRIPSIHCKDMGEDRQDIELGDGVFDWRRIIDAAERSGTRTLVVEMDTPRLEPMESARRSLRGLRQFV